MAVNTSSPKAASPSPENSSPALAFNAATSASVSRGFPANAAGRSTGVALLFAHTPCRSGWPSAVRGGVHFVDAALSLAVRVCAWAAGIKVPTSHASAISTPVRSPILMVHPLWLTAFGEVYQEICRSSRLTLSSAPPLHQRHGPREEWWTSWFFGDGRATLKLASISERLRHKADRSYPKF